MLIIAYTKLPILVTFKMFFLYARHILAIWGKEKKAFTNIVYLVNRYNKLALHNASRNQKV